jgi:PAS domain S-box-containing protein
MSNEAPHVELPSGKLASRAEGVSAADHGAISAVIVGMPGAACFVARDKTVLYANDAFLTGLNLKPEDVLGNSTVGLFGHDIVDSMAPLIARVFAGEPIHLEGWSKSPYGTHYVRQSFTPFDNGRDGVSGYFMLAIDLTASKLRERELEEQYRIGRENDALYSAIIATSLDCIIIVDGDGRVIDFNPASEKLFGYTRAEAVGREISSLIIPEKYRSAHHSGMARYLATGITSVIGQRVEVEAVTKHGAMVPVELSLADVSEGERRFFTAHIRDLTTAKTAQFEIERQREALYQKEKLAALGSLLSGVAHELNNPLSIVLGQAMMLRERISREGDAIPHGHDYAERALRIETAANRCARIVKTFLAMARQRKAEREYVSLGKVIADAVELLSYSLKTSDVALDVAVADPLPDTFADADLLHQVLVNLIVNARQALEERASAGRRIELSAAHEAASDTIVIRVRDNGGGIPVAIRSRIFDPFFTTKPQDHGTGIGLAVSRGLIEAHNGTLELAEPQPKTGAEFLIRLPVTAREGDHPAEAYTPEPIAARAAQSHVLIVDDEPDLADLIADIVSSQGHQALIAHSGHAAEKLLAGSGGAITAILCDIRMPDGDGPGLYDWLSANRPELMTRIGFVTGDTLGPSAGRFLARTGCPVIEKPFTPEDIGRVLQVLVG